MATKDWKKIGKRIYGGRNHWVNKNNNRIIWFGEGAGDVYLLHISGEKAKKFNSKSQALKFAKQYMRTY